MEIKKEIEVNLAELVKSLILLDVAYKRLFTSRSILEFGKIKCDL